MTDRDKVIKGLECCRWSRQNVRPEKVMCNECPYKDRTVMNAYTVWQSCTNILAGEALCTLKGQNIATDPIYDEEKYGDHLPHCGNCETVLPNNAVYGEVNFCHCCGRPVRWND